MKPNDIVYFEDIQFGHHRFWVVEGVFLGCEGQESLIKLRSLTEKSGYGGPAGPQPTVFVPEPLLRNVTVYTPDISAQSTKQS